MKAVVDKALCSGHGLCAVTAPEVFSLDDDGFNAGGGGTVDVPAGAEAAAWDGARACPESAITTLD